MRAAIFSVFSALLFLQTATAQTLSGQDYARQGISYAREGKLIEAEQELRAAVNSAPADATFRAQLGSILGLQGKWKDALESFQKAVDLAPQNLDFRRETAAVQWQLGLMSAAEKNLQYVLTKHPGDPGGILLLGLVKEKTGDYGKAAELLDSQFELVISQPERTVALFHSVVQSRQQDKIGKIVDELKLHANDEQWEDAISRCIQVAAMGGYLETARTLFSLLPDSNPVQAPAGFQLAKLLYTRSQVSQAKELLLQLAEHGVVSADLQALLGNCFESEHQPELALEAYQRAIQMEPSRIDHYEDLISLLLYLRRTKDTLALVKQALAIAPNDARPWVWKGNVDLHRNSYKDAMEDYKHAAVMDSSNPDALYGISAAYFVTGQTEAAIDECKAGITRFPNDARFYVAYANMLLASPDAIKLEAQGEKLLQKAVKLAPQSAQAHYLLGQLAMQQGKLKEAEAELLLSVQSDPDRSKAHFALAGVYRRMRRLDEAAKEFARYQELKQVEESGTASGMAMPETP